MPWQGEKIGNPVSLDQAGPAAAPEPAPQPAAPAAATRTPASNARNGPQQSRGGPQRGGGGGRDMGPIFPIEGLSPYQNKWVCFSW